MIINFSNIGGGGGGSYVLPIATNETLGGVKVGQNLSIDSAGTLSADVQEIGIATTANTGVVKIGSGINVDSAGTISVESQGVEVVTELPASGTDGQTVILIEEVPEKIVIISTPRGDNDSISVTAIGLTNSILLYNYEWWGERDYVTLNSDHSISIYSSYDQSNVTYTSGQTVDYVPKNGHENTIHFTITSTGFTATSDSGISKENFINDINQPMQEIQTLYTWSDNPILTSDIHYTSDANSGNWCVKYKYSEIPNNTTLLISKDNYSDEYSHYIYENGEIHAYRSNVASGITGDTYTNIPQHAEYEGPGSIVTFWTDDEVIFYNLWFNNKKVYQEISAFYRSGWHKEVEHIVDDNVFYIDYTWYGGDYNLIIKHKYYRLYNVGLKLNPSYQSEQTYSLYSNENRTIGPIFAPTTTGATGYVCVAGNGWAAPTWAAPSSLTGGVSFWKGTQDEYNALGTYDSSTLYIITD